MATIFTRIINGELPGRFVWKDGQSVGILTINPVTPGHVLVIPRKEIDHWEQIDTPTFTHLSDVSQKIGRAVKQAYDAPRMGLLIAGLEVPHLHIHVFPAWSEELFDLRAAETDPDPDVLDESARRIRASLRAMGYQENVPDEPAS
ncbi:diadenosine tetraphosphate hydrolase [Gordonia iterans]|uniref:Diadenosine tetraphosphate hydrolase n=1 Tax=Gordonia iterans TaxID=1004901 RepID=A0A2S0KJ94_9ACTN|nr:HIT family protein [Gordonia iterans]AVM01755.1 diadenosine tetraphosphate hydrolase [Gordonia iterans]